MKRFICALSLLAVASPWACAQSSSSVTIYGIIDTAVERVSGIGPTRDSIVRMPSLTGTFPSRLGFRGSEDLGDGLRAAFTLEQGFAPDQGTLNQGGRMFGRQAFVGLGGQWGTISLGRQYTMLYMSVLDADILGPNLYGSGSLDGYIANARADNSLAYRGTFGGLTVGTTFSLGRDVVAAPAGANCPGENAADRASCREVSAMLKYDTPSWGVGAAVDELRGSAGAAGGLVASSLKDRRSMLNGYVKFSELKLGAGLLHRTNDGSATTPKSDLWWLGAAYAVAPTFVLDGALFRLKFDNSSNKATLAAVRGTYSLSRRTAVYAMAGHISNDGALALSVSSVPGTAPVAGASQTGLAMGVRHSF